MREVWLSLYQASNGVAKGYLCLCPPPTGGRGKFPYSMAEPPIIVHKMCKFPPTEVENFPDGWVGAETPVAP